MKKINYFSIMFFIAFIGINFAGRSWGQAYRVTTIADVDSSKDTLRPGKLFWLRVETVDLNLLPSPPPDTNWCVDLFPIQVTASPGDTAFGSLFPNRVQLHNDTTIGQGVWDSLCYYDPPAGNAGGYYIVIKARTNIFPIPPDSIVGQSQRGLCVWGGPAKQDRQIVAFPNPFGSEKLKSTANGAPPAGQTYIRIYPVSGRGDADVTIKIFDSFGYLVKAFEGSEVIGLNDARGFCMQVTWDGKNEKGHKVSNGAYQICVRVEETEGPAVYTQKIGVLW